MFVTVTLNSGYGISLGPRFFLIPNVGYANPFEANISELLAGKVIEVSDSATEIQVISNGGCENGITLTIGLVPTTTTTAAPTTTTTAAPTTTTTTEATTTTTTTTTAAPTTTTTTAAPTTTTTAAPQCSYDGLIIVCDTTTTTTAAPTTTTTTTAAIEYSFYEATRYDCSTEVSDGTFTIAFPVGTSVNYTKYYNSNTDIGIYAYQPVTSVSSGPGLIMNTTQYNTITIACPII